MGLKTHAPSVKSSEKLIDLKANAPSKKLGGPKAPERVNKIVSFHLNRNAAHEQALIRNLHHYGCPALARLRFARHFNPTSALIDDPFRYPQPDPRAALRLGGEKWLEDVSQMLCIDSAPGVRDLHPHAIARSAGLFGDANPDPAAIRHRVHGVSQKVREHLHELALAYLDGPRSFILAVDPDSASGKLQPLDHQD